MSFRQGAALRKRLAASDGDVVQEMAHDDAQRILVVRTVQDVEPILERNKRKRNETDGYTPDRSMKEMADIPNVIVHRWLMEGFNLFRCTEQELRKKLRDPEWSFLRSSPGRI